jgi:hypothetical protein
MVKLSNIYCYTAWTPEDIQTLKPEWDLNRCENFLEDNEQKIVDRIVEASWEVMESFLDLENE